MDQLTQLDSRAAESDYAHGINYNRPDGVLTRYFAAGSGDALLLIHGGHYGYSDSLDMWSSQLAPLSSTFHVYAPDRLGQGATDNPVADEDYTFDAAYHHLLNWIASVGIRRAHVVGHSRGALFAAALAIDHPALVQTLTLVDTRTLAPLNPAWPMNAAYKDAVRAATAQRPDPDTVRVEPETNSYSSQHISEDFVQRLLELHRLPKTEHAQRKMEVLETSTFLPSIARRHADVLQHIDAHGLSVPVLVVWGVNDPTAQLALGLELFARVCARSPSAAFHALNQAGHYSFREKPAEFNSLLSAFCAAHPIQPGDCTA
jgi:pimeloyl-ACP methyl ester carboxylesterase